MAPATRNPKHCDWGGITWGHYTSKDGIQWTHDDDGPVLQPSETYDQCGIFTGCLIPSELRPRDEPGHLIILYTSAADLPINWALPYTRNSEGLAMATSADGGRTWTKSANNPILAGEPEGIVVTGWRDPFVAKWPALDRARGILADETLYGIISGGIKNSGPALFLYTVATNDVSHWEYLCPLVHIAEGSFKPTRWTGNYGVNWECGNFLTLGESDDKRSFMLIGSEGGVKSVAENGANVYGSWLLWMSGELTQTNDGPRLVPKVFGLLDHGMFYAAASYEHPVTKQRIVWGWLKEDTLALKHREAKGFAGYQGLPRELYLLVISDVVGALSSPLHEIDSLVVKDNDKDGTKIITTLGIRPLPSLESLRRGEPICFNNLTGNTTYLTTCRFPSFELEAVIRIVPTGQHQRVGFNLRHNDDLSRQLAVYFEVQTETIVLDRSQTNVEDGMPRDELPGPFTLLKQTNGWETLRLRIFGDGDTIEIFANDRFALSAVAYLDARYTGISGFVEGEGDAQSVVFESIKIWDDMASCTV
ncbi:hypothetical protein Sste5346_009676 [Sporothrix stenoceras]|uniref:Glycoside hydrolase family 32 protein n=1 Tax=Sporothrix stenoceras TaxID=5173 RepID=A0ABR3YJE6_9PEZI